MPKVSHAMAGWLTGSGSLLLAPATTRPVPASGRVPDQPGLWKYRTLQRSKRILAFSILFSIGLHAFALLGFNQRPPATKRVKVAEDAVIQITMPDLEEDKIDPVDTLAEEQPETPAIAVPLLADLPSVVPIDAFVQPLDFTPALPTSLDAMRLAVIPTNMARNSGSLERLGRIFDVSQLDHQPQPLVQPSPVFPPELTALYPQSSVRLEFIITSRGEVVGPTVISSEHGRFAEAAIRAVEKWKFRPGTKGGRPVNTRTQISIYFHVTN
jgi:protein TonB